MNYLTGILAHEYDGGKTDKKTTQWRLIDVEVEKETSILVTFAKIDDSALITGQREEIIVVVRILFMVT